MPRFVPSSARQAKPKRVTLVVLMSDNAEWWVFSALPPGFRHSTSGALGPEQAARPANSKPSARREMTMENL